MQTKFIAGAIVLAGIIIGGVLFSRGVNTDNSAAAGVIQTGSASTGQAVIEDGVQYVDITARGGYAPRVTKAKAGMPTVIRVQTENTYDCSSSLVVPDIGYQTSLPASGTTEITVPADKTQGTLRGLCAMAMYQFEIDFE